MKKETVPVYEVYTKSPDGSRMVCRTCSLSEARKQYRANRPAHLRIDGVEQTISEAEKLINPGFNRAISITTSKPPNKKENIHQLKPAK